MEDQVTLKNNLKRFVRGFRIGVAKNLPEILSLIPFFDKEIAKKLEDQNLFNSEEWLNSFPMMLILQ